MPIKVTCSNCGGVLHAPDDAGGKRGRCPTCGNILPIPAAGGGGDLPDPPAHTPGQRPPSFADFALGPQVGPPPGGSGDAARASTGARASIPFATEPASPPPPPQRAKAPAEPAAARRPADPFARKGAPKAVPTAAPPVTEGAVKGWKRSRGGLGWVQAANFLLFIPVVLLPGYFTADAVMKAISAAEVKDDLIPYRHPGYLGLDGVDTRAELALLAGGAPVLLALIMNLFGRLGFAGAPKRSAVGGPAMLSAMGTLIAVCCALAVIAPNVFGLIQQTDAFPGRSPLFVWDSYVGMIQRLGIFVGLAAVAVGEFWFASAIGRVGSALADGRPAARSTRYLMLLGLVVIGLVGTASIAPSRAFGLGAPAYDTGVGGGDEFPRYTTREQYDRIHKTTVYKSARTEAAENPAHEVGRETNELVAGQWEKNVTPLFAQAGAYQPVIAPALFLLFGFIVWVMYVRMVGAARGAMAGWLDAHEGSA